MLRFPAGKMSRKQKVVELCEKVQRDLKLAGLPRDGCATDGTDYSSILAMWSSELGYGSPAVGAGFRRMRSRNGVWRGGILRCSSEYAGHRPAVTCHHLHSSGDSSVGR